MDFVLWLTLWNVGDPNQQRSCGCCYRVGRNNTPVSCRQKQHPQHPFVTLPTHHTFLYNPPRACVFRFMKTEKEIREIRFELCGGWQMANQVSFLKDLVGQQNPSLSDRLVFTEYEDKSPMRVHILQWFHVDGDECGAEDCVCVLVRSHYDRHRIRVSSLLRSYLLLSRLPSIPWSTLLKCIARWFWLSLLLSMPLCRQFPRRMCLKCTWMTNWCFHGFKWGAIRQQMSIWSVHLTV